MSEEVVVLPLERLRTHQRDQEGEQSFRLDEGIVAICRWKDLIAPA